MWGGSSAGRASRSHREGQGFDPPPLHHFMRTSRRAIVGFFVARACPTGTIRCADRCRCRVLRATRRNSHSRPGPRAPIRTPAAGADSDRHRTMHGDDEARSSHRSAPSPPIRGTFAPKDASLNGDPPPREPIDPVTRQLVQRDQPDNRDVMLGECGICRACARPDFERREPLIGAGRFLRRSSICGSAMMRPPSGTDRYDRRRRTSVVASDS